MRRRNLAASMVILGTPIILCVWMLLAKAAPPGAAADFAEASEGPAPFYLVMLDDLSWIAWVAPLAMLVSAALVLFSSSRIHRPSVLRLGLVLAFELAMLLIVWRWLGREIGDAEAPASPEAHVPFANGAG